MTKTTITIWVIVALIVGGVVGYLIHQPASTMTSQTTDKSVSFEQAMRKLWEDHITFTRLYIVEATAGLPGADATAARLMQNQVDIGNAIKPYYGDDAGNKLTQLLKDHITGAVEILNAAKAGDNKKLNDAKTAWYQNANDIASFLSGANPNWPLADMQSSMKMHLDLTLQEAVDQLQKNYPASVADYDKVHEEILSMADVLSSGIIKQFPDKFK